MLYYQFFHVFFFYRILTNHLVFLVYYLKNKFYAKHFVKIETCCVNCGNSHSSYCRGCQAYKDIMKKEITKVKEVQRAVNYLKPNNMSVPEGFKRNYSVVSNPIT